MTAIAYRDGVLAADSAATSGGLFTGSAVKLARGNTGIAGGSGAASAVHAFLQLVRSAARPEEIIGFRAALDPDEDFSALFIDNQGNAWEGSGKRDLLLLVEEPWTAIGCCWEFLYGTLAAGASAEQAVTLACEHVAICRGPVMTLRL